jgi:hypothetical protein
LKSLENNVATAGRDSTYPQTPFPIGKGAFRADLQANDDEIVPCQAMFDLCVRTEVSWFGNEFSLRRFDWQRSSVKIRRQPSENSGQLCVGISSMVITFGVRRSLPDSLLISIATVRGWP